MTELTREDITNWKKAGEITARSLEFAKHLIKDGMLLLEFAEKVEAKIHQLGGAPAFPLNISLNEVAAHYTPAVNDKKEFNGEIVKIDAGAHVNGHIGDSALTVDLSKENNDLLKASKEALDNAVKLATPGTPLAEIGRTIEETIKKYGFVPVKNLSGHGLGLYNLHSGINIPNYDSGDVEKLEEGMIIAIEPFATNGAGFVIESNNAEIFSLARKKPVRSPVARQILKEIELFNGLPFTTRWFTKKIPLFKASFALKELNNAGCLRLYPPLIDRNRGLVSQAEHSLIVKDKPIILTKAD